MNEQDILEKMFKQLERHKFEKVGKVNFLYKKDKIQNIDYITGMFNRIIIFEGAWGDGWIHASWKHKGKWQEEIPALVDKMYTDKIAKDEHDKEMSIKQRQQEIEDALLLYEIDETTESKESGITEFVNL